MEQKRTFRGLLGHLRWVLQSGTFHGPLPYFGQQGSRVSQAVVSVLRPDAGRVHHGPELDGQRGGHQCLSFNVLQPKP